MSQYVEILVLKVSTYNNDMTSKNEKSYIQSAALESEGDYLPRISCPTEISGTMILGYAFAFGLQLPFEIHFLG